MPRSRNIATPNSRRSHLNGPSSRPSEPPPSWPVLQPLIPTSSLDLETLIPDQILIIRNLFTSTLCKKLVSFLATLPLVTTPGKPKRGDALRVNDRFEVDDWGFAERLWRGTGLEELVMGRPQEEGVEEREGQDVEGHIRDDERRKLWGGEVLGLNPRVRVYRYGRGQFFGQHYDESNSIILPSSPPTPAKTTWTLLLYLTGPATGCIGGETIFYPELGQAKAFCGATAEETSAFPVGLEVGMALLHRHGDLCMLHEGSEVQEGEKWVLRSDLCVRR